MKMRSTFLVGAACIVGNQLKKGDEIHHCYHAGGAGAEDA